ncbi:MAG TPA: MoxR family ATPase [Acidobacteriota bacterium]|nr:MoxR family ATPase [Acidobacteriota bacterium]
MASQIKDMVESQERILAELRKVIVGQDEVIEQVLIALYTGGNSLITGLPGLAKTLLIQCIAETVGLTFNRIQFTPDLMPADITGTEILQQNPETGRRNLTFVPGPIFANMILADEINRTPPKTQAAMLEAMQEKSVTVLGQTYRLEMPFLVLATQNPIELEGTYPLPEAQMDRFMFNIIIDYLTEEEEMEVVDRTTGKAPEAIVKTIKREDILRFQRLVRAVPASDDVTRYAVRVARATRPADPLAPDFVSKYVQYGASLRAAQFMILGGKARALLRGRYNVACQDILALAKPVLRHRVLVNFHAESEGVTTDDLIERLGKSVDQPASGI